MDEVAAPFTKDANQRWRTKVHLIKHNKMDKNKFGTNKNLSIILLLAFIMQLIEMPVIDENMIASLMVLGVAIYLLVKK